MGSRYFFREAGRIRGGLTPETLVTELERIRIDHGDLSSSAVVDESEPEDAVLHDQFTWDDSKAGRNWRLEEARRLIRVVQVETSQGERHSLYEHVPLIVKGEGAYQTIEVLTSRPDLYALALEEALRALSSAQERVNGLRRYAEEGDRMGIIVLAVQALQTAEQAVRQLH